MVAPVETPVATPVTAMVATPGALDAHVTDEVTGNVVESEKVPVAVKDWGVPAGTLGLGGATWIEDSVADVTINDAVFDTLLLISVAVIVTGPPTATPVAIPLEDMVAVPGALEVQATRPV